MSDHAGPRVVYILGWGRSGSTLLDSILGSVEGVCAVGELHYLWSRGLVANRKCGCGQRFNECPHWQGVVNRLGDRFPEAIDGPAVHRLHNRVARARSTPLLLYGTEPSGAAVAEYRRILRETYVAILHQSGADVVVDSSKRPSEAAVILNDPGLDPYFVHIVRDPRAVAFSWQRLRSTGDAAAGSQMVRRGVLESSSHWLAWNAAAEVIRRKAPDRFVRIRYEDLVARPNESIADILRAAHLGQRRAPRFTAGEATLARSHSVSGNPSRFDSTTVRLRPDLEWRTKLSRRHAALVVGICAPLMPRYGYGLLGR